MRRAAGPVGGFAPRRNLEHLSQGSLVHRTGHQIGSPDGPPLARRLRPPPARPSRAGHAAAKSRRYASGPTISADKAGCRRRRCRSQTGAAARPSTCRCRRATAGGPWADLGADTDADTAAALGPFRAVLGFRDLELPMPHQRRLDLPRVVVNGIEGRDPLYEFDRWAAPSPQWRAAFLRPPPSLLTADRNVRGWPRGDPRGDPALPHPPRHLGGWLPFCATARVRPSSSRTPESRSTVQMKGRDVPMRPPSALRGADAGRPMGQAARPPSP